MNDFATALTLIALLTAVVLQGAAATLMWRARATYTKRRGWKTLSAAMALLTVRHLLALGQSLDQALTTRTSQAADLVQELAFAVTAGLLLSAVVRVRDTLRSADRARAEAVHSREETVAAERRWREVFEHAPDAYVLLDFDGRMVRANRGVSQLLGVDPESLRDRTIFDLGIEILAAPDTKELLREARRGQHTIGPIEYTISTAVRGRMCIELLAHPVHIDGEALMLTIVRDMTARQETENQLRDSQARLAEAQRVSRLATWEIDLRTGELHTSRTPGDFDAEEGANRTLSLAASLDYVHPDDRALVEEMIQSAIEGTSDGASAEYRLVGPQGNWIHCHTIARIERDEAGAVVRLIGATQDISRLRAAEAAARRLNAELERRVDDRTRELERAVAELQAFSYSVSHDLRAPLRAMASFSQAALEDFGDNLPAQLQNYLERIHGSGVRMAAMIDDLLKLARLSRAEVERRFVDLSALAQEIVAELRDGDPERRIEVHIEEGIAVVGDAGMLRIVLQNLIGNAWKFTRDREGARIDFGATTNAGEVHAYVRDNGVGFDPEQSAKMFRAFERLHRTDEFEGSGIGLATVERITRRHGGRVWAEGRPGRGATFFVALPVATEAAAEPDAAAQAGETHPPRKVASSA